MTRKTIALLCVAQLVAAPSIPALAQGARSPVQLLHESREMLGAGNVASALERAQSAVDADPAFAQAWKQLGRVQMLHGDAQEAYQSFTTALQLMPADREISIWMLSVLLELEKYDALTAHLDSLDVPARKSLSEEWYARTVQRLWYKGARSQAGHVAALAARVHDSAPVRGAAAAIDALARGNTAAAAQRLRTTSPGSAAPWLLGVAWYGLGRDLQAQDNRPEATAAYEHALALLPGWIPAARELGWARRVTGDSRGAAAAWTSSASTGKSPAQWWYWIALAHFDAGSNKDALIALDTLLKREPEHAEGRALKLAILLLNKSPDADAYESRLSASPRGTWLVVQGRTIALRKQGDYRAAASQLEEWREREPAAATELLADTYARWAAGAAPTDAVFPLENLVALQPDRVSAWRDLGWTYWTLGRRDDALISWSRAVQGNLPEQRELSLQVLARLVEEGQLDLALATHREWNPKESLTDLGLELVNRNRLLAARPILLAAWNAGQRGARTGLYLAYTEANGGRCVGLTERLEPVLAGGLGSLSGADTDRLFDALLACSDDPGVDPLVRRVTAAAADTPALTARVAALLGRSATARAAARDQAQAFALFQQSLRRNPDQPQVWPRAARLGVDIGRADDVSALLEWISAHASAPAVRDGVNGYRASAQGDRETAVRLYRLSLASDPDQPDLRMALFNDLLALERYGDARDEAQWFTRRWALGDTGVRSQLAAIRAGLGDHPRALALWRELRMAHPETPYYALETARALFTMCRSDEATAVLGDIVARNPDPRAYELLAEIEQALGQPRKALDWTTAGLSQGTSTGLLRVRAEAAEAAGENAIARDAAERVLAADPGNAAMAGLLGRVLLAGQDPDIARVHYTGLLERNPQFLPALVHLRDIAAAAGDREAALDYAMRIAQERPADSTARRRLASAQAEAAEFSPALAAMRNDAGLAANALVPVLVYGNVTSCSYPGRNTASQVVAHIERLAASGVTLVGFNGQPAGDPPPARAVIVILNAEEDALRPIDDAIARVGGMAVYAADGTRRASLADTLTRLAKSGRWQIASAGPADTRRAAVDALGRLGSPLTHRLVVSGEPESEATQAARLDATLARAAVNLPENGPRVLVYPGGDYGQLSLDTDSSAISALRTAAGRHFTVALARDDDGFVRPDSDALRLPALSVPPGWDADTLATQLARSRPTTLAALQLGKILSWHGQHVAADRWFVRAADRGADPLQVHLFAGTNADFEGDLPNALEHLRTAAQLDPDSPRVRDALQRAEDRKRLRIDADGQYWRDSDDRTYRRTGAEAGAYLSDSLRVLLFADHNRWERKGLGDEDGARLGAGLRWHFATGDWLDARIWNMDLDDIKDHTGWKVGVHLPLPWSTGTLDLQASRDQVDTVEAVRAGILADTLAARGYLRVADVWDLHADLGFIDRTDGNDTWLLTGRFVRRFSESPYLGLGYRFRFGDSDRDPPEYWAPLGLQQHQVYAAWRGEAGPLAYSLSAEAGYAREEDSDWRFVWGGRGSVDYRAGRYLSVGAEARRLETPDYTRDDYLLRLQIRF